MTDVASSRAGLDAESWHAPSQQRVVEAVSADAIADAVGRFRPTAQQRAVIEAPLSPSLVVAGAGSGKTETMANRVLWLLANGLVRPDQILGLTFTRKAAGELGLRIRERIGELSAAGMMPGYDVFDAPTVSTYNSFANLIYRDHAALLGREGDGAVLGEAAAWQLARSTVTRSSDPRLPDLGKNLDQVTAAVLGLARSLAENVADPEEVRAFSTRFAALGELPAGSARGELAAAADLAQTVGALDVLVDLAGELTRQKTRRGAVEYSDQVALALAIVEAQPGVVADLRDGFRVVLLDEYQDTSVVQTRLLARIFAGHPVMAVGDPNQSIYGWRGASAANLDQFASRFGAGDRRFSLSTSWRNGRRILDLANAVVTPLVGATRVAVDRLEPSPTASSREVAVAFPETVVEEAAATADWLADRLRETGVDGSVPSAALLFRARKTQQYFLAALRERGIPFHVLGIGGILAEPEIADLVCALSVVDDPGAGLELVRLLGGSRWRIGVQDLHALSRLASWVRDRDLSQTLLDDEVRERLRSSPAEGDGASIVDALDFIATAKPTHVALERFSEPGRERLADAGRFFERLRSRSGLDLPDFVTLVEQELQLDIEIAANDYRALGSANLEAFYDALSGYLAIADTAHLRGFLGWLREAEQREDLSPRPEDPEPGTVQVLTIHGSKGLEWDVVAVPRLVEDELPARPREGHQGWLSFGTLPWPFRGDAEELPVLEWEDSTTRKEFLAAVTRFKDGVRRHGIDEERRLAYVAVTRARHSLYLSGSFWATQAKPRLPSPFLTELSAAGLVDSLPESTSHEENPLGEELERITWPADPLGSRRRDVQAAADAVSAASPEIAGPWSREIELLLAERARRLDPVSSVASPDRVPASRFKDFVTDPAGVAAGLMRPMPERPYRATRLGTLFHSWVEQRYGVNGTGDGIDLGRFDQLAAEGDGQEPDSEHGDPEAVTFERLQAVFEESEWAGRQPIDVEREIHLPLDGHVIICKIDAVYSLGGGGDQERFEVVDWKTGRMPQTTADREQRQLQLALYRLAFAKWKGIDPERVTAVFFYVAENRVVVPEHLYDERQLVAMWRNGVAGSPLIDSSR